MRSRYLLGATMAVAACATLMPLSNADAQEVVEVRTARVAPPLNTFTMNPLDLANGILNFELEHAMTPMTSAYAALNFLVGRSVFVDRTGEYQRTGIFGVGPELGLRLFLMGLAPEGLWVGPYGSVAFLTADQNSSTGFQVGGMAGFTVILLDTFNVSIGAGAGYNSLVIDRGDGTGQVQYGYLGWTPRLRLALGVAF